MYKDVLRSIEGIGIFPIIGLVLFITFFVVMVIYLIKKGRGHYEHAAHLPLESDEEIEKQNEDEK
jgi:cbb3-type cytochrome oxidase subunit 3